MKMNLPQFRLPQGRVKTPPAREIKVTWNDNLTSMLDIRYSDGRWLQMLLPTLTFFELEKSSESTQRNL